MSEVTIRKDLSILEEMGCLIRTRGGAQMAEDTRLLRPIETRQAERLAQKRAIARKARTLIAEGETIYIDAGSACLCLAREIRDMNLRVVTNSIDVMVELANRPAISLFSLGGSYRKEAGSFIGPIASEALKSFQIETCFLGTTGLSRRGVFSAQNIIESQLKQAVLSSSARRIVLADSSKYGRDAFSVFARAGDVDILVTDDEFEDAKNLNSFGIEVVIGEIVPAPETDGHAEPAKNEASG
ncbi:MAG: DeoR/GlpR transcriptional regulator [Spirochaetaceae bacterium]|nr:MAG: DeoR/GlpR transcriptional regulator [Spirochaetaceae bacterium]